MIVQYWGNEGSQRSEMFKNVFMKYVERKYIGNDEIEVTRLTLHEGNTNNPFLQIKFIENGSIHDHRIRLDRLPKYCKIN